MMEMIKPEDFFRRFGTPDTWEPMTRCGGVVTGEETDDELRERGLSDGAIAELRAYAERLRRKNDAE